MTVLAKNKAAYHHYEIKDSVECGVVLNGGEVKSILQHGTTFGDAYAQITDNELWLHNLHISPYKFAALEIDAVPSKRPKKLLAHKKEIRALHRHTTQKGATLIPLSINLSSNHLIKIVIGICIGKKLYDKRQALKQKEHRKEMNTHYT